MLFNSAFCEIQQFGSWLIHFMDFDNYDMHIVATSILVIK